MMYLILVVGKFTGSMVAEDLAGGIVGYFESLETHLVNNQLSATYNGIVIDNEMGKYKEIRLQDNWHMEVIEKKYRELI
ncbi:MAG: hypothetical protein PHI22_01150 [Bacilli bacterium]|nr:hypothetical protein [Bacilli bacterium]